MVAAIYRSISKDLRDFFDPKGSNAFLISTSDAKYLFIALITEVIHSDSMFSMVASLRRDFPQLCRTVSKSKPPNQDEIPSICQYSINKERLRSHDSLLLLFSVFSSSHVL